MKDSLWSVDLFRCESMFLKSHWVMVVMDQFTRKIMGLSAHRGDVDGIALCCMFNQIIADKKPPKYLSCDNDPLFQSHRWKANLRVLNIKEIKTVPEQPRSHPFIERIIGTIRREFVDHILFWTKIDLQNKLKFFQQYYNRLRPHMSLNAQTPLGKSLEKEQNFININKYSWAFYCCGLF